uniref:Major facilitator superfamily (MFS) profile domain-containing protein n=1 Tax=Setaria italica TaxID=4555 RepID=K4AL25_SETIT
MQLLKAVFVVFAWAFDAQQVFISVFTDAEPLWHCVGSAGNSSCTTAAVATPCALPRGMWAWDRPTKTSVVSEWALQCAGPALVSLPASSFFAGCLAGGFLLTTLADSLLGRKKMLLVSLASMSIAGVLTAFAPNVWAYAALRFVSGFARSIVGTCTLVLSTELVGKSSGVAARPRWLLVRSRTQEAVETLQRIASLNGGSSAATASFSMLHHACATDEEAAASGGGVFSTLRMVAERSWAIRRLAAIMVAGFGVGMVYFGLPLGVGSLGSNLYLSTTYNALAEVPSAALSWLLAARARRRVSLVALAAAAGAFSLACVAVPRGAGAARMAAELVSFFATCTAYDLILIYSIELFPITSVRNSAVGLVRQWGMIWSFGVFGLAIGCAGLFAACLPETRGKSMSDTMEEEERNEAAAASCTSRSSMAKYGDSNLV